MKITNSEDKVSHRFIVLFLALIIFWLAFPISGNSELGVPEDIAWAKAAAAANVQVLNPEATYTFGGELTLRAIIQSEVPVQSVVVFLQATGTQNAIQGQAIPEQDGHFIYVHDLTKQPLRAFAKINYWFGILLQNGEIVASPIFSFYYEDNRYTWQTLEFKPFRLHWYEGNLSFAQEIFNTAWDGWVRAKRILPIFPPERVEIYVYASAREVQSTLQLGAQTWVAGHADPDLGVIAVSLPPGPEQRLEMARQIPHELMHIMIYKKVGDAYVNLPVWFNEGLASAVELYPDPNYPLLMQTAYQKDGLIPMTGLCQSFPKNASSALLAYAEASSFVNYLYRRFGNTGMEALLKIYADGLACERGFEAALGSPLAKVEQGWLRDTFETSPALSGLENLMPWVVVLAVIVVVPLAIGVRGIALNRKEEGEI